MKKRGWIILSLCLLIGAGTAYYFLFAGEKEDPNLAPLKAELQKIQEQNLNPQQAIAAHRQIHEKARSLSDSARHELFRTFGQGMRKRMQQQVDAYFKAPPEKQQAVLDQQIRQMEAFRQQMQAARPQGRPGGPGGQRGERAGRGGPRGRPNLSPEQRDQRRKGRMERGDPQARSRMMEYFDAMRDRRKELGLPSMGPPHRR